MPKLNEVYKCDVCGNIVEVLHAGPAALTCCNQKMTLMSENTVDAAVEKHVPVIEVGADSITVKVGSVAHPMQDEHFIEWIELIADGTAYRRFRQPGMAAEAVFCLQADKVTAREHCNIHGLWKG